MRPEGKIRFAYVRCTCDLSKESFFARFRNLGFDCNNLNQKLASMLNHKNVITFITVLVSKISQLKKLIL